MLGVLLHALRGPFYSPKAEIGAVGDPIGRQFFPSVRWCTGQSGAPPDINSGCPVPDLRPYRAKPTVGASVPLHTGQSGVTIRPLARPRVTR
jgi:hypothetical protein